MQARKAGIIGGTLAVALACALGGTFAVTQALAIGDEAGNAIDVSPLVVGSSAKHPSLVTLVQAQPDADADAVAEADAAEHIVEVEAPPVAEVVTAPEPRRAPSAVPPAVVTPPAPHPARPAPQPAPPAQITPPSPAPLPERPAQPQRPSMSDVKRWLETGAYDEALAWAKAHGWTEQNIRDAMNQYSPKSGWQR